MKSLEERLADRERREAEAEAQREENGTILTESTGATGEGRVADQEGDGEEEEEEEEVSYSAMTVAQLKEELDGRTVEYKTSDKKDDLIALLEKHDADNAG